MSESAAAQAVPGAPEKPARGWAWWTGGRSPDEGVVSILGLVETLLAMAAYGYIAWRWGTLHLTVSACVAPLLLLRTPRSVALGFGWARAVLRSAAALEQAGERAIAWADESNSNAFRGLLALPVILLSLSVHIVLIGPAVAFVRAAATAVSALSHPIATFRAVPRNWWRVVGCTDSRQEPQALPAPNSYQATGEEWIDVFVSPAAVFSDAAMAFWSRPGGRAARAFVAALKMTFVFVAMSLIILPAILYRWSLKGTALAWSPLVWVVHGTFSSKLRDRMHDVRELALTRVATICAAVVLALFAAKLAAYYATTSLAERCSSWLRPDLCKHVVVPDAFPPWQLASAANALLGLVLFFVADWYLHQLKHQRQAPEGLLDGTVKAVWFVRGFLSLYTIACTIYIAAALTRRWGLPPLGTAFFPWQ